MPHPVAKVLTNHSQKKKICNPPSSVKHSVRQLSTRQYTVQGCIMKYDDDDDDDDDVDCDFYDYYSFYHYRYYHYHYHNDAEK